LLTRPFAIEGTVQHGDKNGRKLGYPTANIDMGSYLRPRYGIYAVKGRLPDGRLLNGAANLGIRPQFDPPKELLEPYFFDFSEDLYGQTIEVELHAFIRGEERFDSLDALCAQMARDCDTARGILANAALESG
jgi:riboflavin kinase / FMN adenylyltransferase